MDLTRPKPKHSIPADAKTVFDGILFDVVQWEQELYDGSHTTFEVLKRSDTAMVVPVTDCGTILLLEQEQPGKPPFTGVPGGRLDPGEDPLDAIKRELLEETGYQADSWVLWDSFQPLSKLDWAIYLFIARGAVKTTEQNLDAGEKAVIKEVSYEEFLQETFSAEFADIEISLKTMRSKVLGTEEQLRKQILG